MTPPLDRKAPPSHAHSSHATPYHALPCPSVSIISCVYGGHHRFVRQWANAVKALNPAPARILLAGDQKSHVRGVLELVTTCTRKHPQAFYLNLAIDYAETDWVWIVDIDDIPMVDGLAGIEDVWADVWALGYLRSDGEWYIPPPVTPEIILAADHSMIPGASAFRVQAFRDVGGFPDIALQDWGLWRRMARAGKTFDCSDRAHFHYMRHPTTRGVTELTQDVRGAHLVEMMEAELAVV